MRGKPEMKYYLGTRQDSSKEELLKQTDLEEETIDEVLRVLSSEFEDEKPVAVQEPVKAEETATEEKE